MVCKEILVVAQILSPDPTSSMNLFTPSRNILSESQLYDKYLQTKYKDVSQYLSDLGDDPEVSTIIDDVIIKFGLEIHNNYPVLL